MEKDVLFWKNIANLAQTTGQVFAALFGVAYLIVNGYAQYKINTIENKISSKQNKESDELKNSIESLNAKFNDRADESYSGFSITLGLGARNNKTSEREFFFDSGNEEDKNRISLYLDSKKNLVYRIIDSESESHIIKVPQSDFTFQENKVYLYTLEYGYSDRYSFMRIFIDGKELARNVTQYKLNLPSTVEGFNIGGDITNKHYSAFQIVWFDTAKVTLSKEQREWKYNSIVELLRATGRI